MKRVAVHCACMLEIVALIAFFEKLFRVNGNYHLCPGCSATAAVVAVAGLPLRVLVVLVSSLHKCNSKLFLKK